MRLRTGAVALSLLFQATAAFAKDQTPVDCASDVSDQQGITGFSSLVDGQPTDPKAPTLSLSLSRSQGQSVLQPVLQLAPGSKRGWCDAVVSVMLPAVQANGRVTLAQNVGVSWEQRWQEDTGSLPTFATLTSVIVDYSGPSAVTSVSATAIVAKTFGPLVGYFNGTLSTQFGEGADHSLVPSAVIGLKWPPRGNHALVADVVFTKGAPDVAELSYQFEGPYDLGIGPGLAMTLDGRRTVTAGIVVQKEF